MEFKTLFYVIGMVVYLIYKVVKARNKTTEENPPVSPPTPNRQQKSPQPEEKQPSMKELFGELMKEFEEKPDKQYEESYEPPQPVFEEEVIEEVPNVFTNKEAKAALIAKEGRSVFESSINADTNELVVDQGGDTISEYDIISENELMSFEFEPRRAFMLKELLDRPYK